MNALEDTVRKLLDSFVNNTAPRTSLSSDFFVIGFIVLVIALVLYVIIDGLRFELKRGRKSRSKTKEKKLIKIKKGKNDSMEKRADLVYYQVNPPPKGSLKWERTGRGIRSICLATKRKTLQESEEMLQLFRFNGDWLFFRNPKLLTRYQLEMFNQELEEGKKKDNLDFNWVGQPMKISPKYRSKYEVDVDGYYPHLGQNEKRVSLLLVKFKDVEVNKYAKDRFLLFEDTELIGGIAWQGKKVYVWSGDKLTEEEIAEVKDDYLEREVNGVKPDFDMMI